jgi:hypothetical protein
MTGFFCCSKVGASQVQKGNFRKRHDLVVVVIDLFLLVVFDPEHGVGWWPSPRDSGAELEGQGEFEDWPYGKGNGMRRGPPFISKNFPRLVRIPCKIIARKE